MTDVDLLTGTETYPHVDQSTTFSWGNPDNPDQIVVAYNDIRGSGSGASVSTDGGLTFTRLTKANGQSPFPNTGDPVVLYNRPTATWHTIWVDGGCDGLGGYKSTTPWDPDSWTHYCIHSSFEDDRESGWTDMNPSSPFYGRMYVSWNHSADLLVRYSTDNGLTWTNERQLNTSFIRNVHITGDLVTGDVYIAGMDEGSGCTSGCGSNRSNKIYRSTDGGNTWTNSYIGPTFVGACRGNVGYFCTMYSSPSPYWRHMGWGEPAAYNGVVHYVYAARNPGNGDPGNVFYIRSTDSGVTFSAPFQLNSNTDPLKAQWEPSLSVSASGTLFAVWYDERDGGGASTCIAGSNSPCYRMYARRSNDNGLTWLPDDAFSDVVSPLPAQPDPGIVSYYVSDYDYASAIATKHLASWVDGRVPINGTYQQDAFTDRELVATSTPTPTATPTPAGCSVTSTTCGTIVVGTPPTDFRVNLSDPADPATVDGSDFMLNGTPANSATLLNGNFTITFHFNTSPAGQGQNTMHIPAGAFNCGNGGVLEFTCTFTYEASTPTPTPTASLPPSPTPTTTSTPTSTPRPSPTPRPALTPRPRPTPPPRP